MSKFVPIKYRAASAHKLLASLEDLRMRAAFITLRDALKLLPKDEALAFLRFLEASATSNQVKLKALFKAMARIMEIRKEPPIFFVDAKPEATVLFAKIDGEVALEVEQWSEAQ